MKKVAGFTVLFVLQIIGGTIGGAIADYLTSDSFGTHDVVKDFWIVLVVVCIFWLLFFLLKTFRQ